MPEDTTPTTETPKSGGKSNAALIIIIIVVALVVLGVGGYFVSRYIGRKAADKITGNILSSTTGDKVKVDSNSNNVTVNSDGSSTTAGENVKWPSDMPSIVPKYTAGKIALASKSKVENGDTWSVSIGNTSQAEYDAYKAEVLKAGWTLESTTSAGMSIDDYTKDNYELGLLFISDESGGTVSITLSPAS